MQAPKVMDALLEGDDRSAEPASGGARCLLPQWVNATAFWRGGWLQGPPEHAIGWSCWGGRPLTASLHPSRASLPDPASAPLAPERTDAG